MTSGMNRLAGKAEALLATIAPGAVCVPQEWDERVDCLLTLADGRVIGEMFKVEELTDSRIRQTAERFRRWSDGVEVELVNPIRPPVKIADNPVD